MTAFAGEVHPLAEVWPMLPDDELRSLADSIAANGLREPIVVDHLDRLIDGRNRLAACRLAGVHPTFVTVPGVSDEESVAAFIGDRNAERRHLTTGQQAMGRALMLQAQGKRKNGRWERGSVVNGSSSITTSDEIKALTKAGLVLDTAARAAALGADWAEYAALPGQVMSKETTLDFAYRACQAFEGKAALAEAMKTQPLTHALVRAEVILDELEALLPLPPVPVPLSRAQREQIDALNRRARTIAARLTTYAKESQ